MRRRQLGYIMVPRRGILARRASGGDPDFASVVLLALNENGADGSTTFDDASTSDKALTANGNAQWDTAQAPTGLTSSGLFDGVGDSITTPDSVDWDLPGDFTVEIWFRPTALPANYAHLIGSDGGSVPVIIYVRNSTNSGRIEAWDSGSALLMQGGTTSAGGAFYAVAWTRSGSDNSLYLDGTRVATATASTSIAPTGSMGLGRGPSAANWDFNGHLAAARITKGVARYTGASYSVPMLPLPTS